MSTIIQKIIKQSKNPKFIEEVFEFAKNIYGDKKLPSGELFIDHALQVAMVLNEAKLDPITIAASLLHDTANQEFSINKEDTLKEIEVKFGPDVKNIVEKNIHLKKIYYSFTVNKNEEHFLDPKKAENLRKMFLAMASDVRVVLVELAARIDGMQHIAKLPGEKQKIYATETLHIFVPIANRLGLGDMKRKLEDTAFAFLFPEKFNWLAGNIKEKYEQRQAYLTKFIPHFKKALKHEKIHFLEINFRAKSYWSTYQKLERHNMDFEKIYDLVALRLIVKDVATCYRVLGIIHKLYPPISGQIQDYIAKPKENGYKSLHTTVFLEPGKSSEIQIRTAEMDQEAEYGICAHWSYKEKIDLSKHPEKLTWSKKIPQFLQTFNIDFYADQIFTFTPKGDIIALPKGATAIDFAYAVHSDIGNHCESAKIDGKIIPLVQPLHNGDVVEIITNKKRVPSQSWLKYVKTSFARSHIKKATTSITSTIFSVPSFIKRKISEYAKNPTEKPAPTPIAKSPNQVYLAGQKGMLVNFAKCCDPKTNEPAKAYLTRHRAAVLHKDSCINLQKLAQIFPEKVIEATWEVG